MRSFAAIDLHSNNGVLTVIDENDRVLRQKKLANRLDLFVSESRAVPTNAGGSGGGVDVQLVLARRWSPLAQVSAHAGEHVGGQAIRGTQAHRRQLRRKDRAGRCVSVKTPQRVALSILGQPRFSDISHHVFESRA